MTSLQSCASNGLCVMQRFVLACRQCVKFCVVAMWTQLSCCVGLVCVVCCLHPSFFTHYSTPVLCECALSSAVRALLGSAQAAIGQVSATSSEGENSTAPADASTLFSQARSYAEVLRTRFKAFTKDADVARALSAADLAKDAEKGMSTTSTCNVPTHNVYSDRKATFVHCTGQR